MWRNILRKRGVRSRAQIAAWAPGHRLGGDAAEDNVGDSAVAATGR
jgi:hypothetical protein